ncbi:hypothetical protein AGMMS49990_10220 [Endomicrobiia bacterium]|nr:hypothetical protein AGMMS49990_10220 [Endomicrobiia bacterium]
MERAQARVMELEGKKTKILAEVNETKEQIKHHNNNNNAKEKAWKLDDAEEMIETQDDQAATISILNEDLAEARAEVKVLKLKNDLATARIDLHEARGQREELRGQWKLQSKRLIRCVGC